MKKEVIKELTTYAELENSEIGELCLALVDFWRYRQCFMTKIFEKALEDEIKAHLANFKENSIIEEQEITTVNKYKYLEWK